jgi:hypothetical protein
VLIASGAQKPDLIFSLMIFFKQFCRGMQWQTDFNLLIIGAITSWIPEKLNVCK